MAKRIKILLPDEQLLTLKREARRGETSVDALIRSMIDDWSKGKDLYAVRENETV
jgi:hypothetical protein